jgi:hypothetical protein
VANKIVDSNVALMELISTERHPPFRPLSDD